MGIKIGDVNNTVVANSNASGSEQFIHLSTNSKFVNKGDLIDISINVSDNQFKEFIEPLLSDGLQGTFHLDGLEYHRVKPGLISLSEEHFGIHDDHLSFSWNDPFDINANNQTPLFTLTFIAQKSGQLSDMISLSDEVATSEIYFPVKKNKDEIEYEIRPLHLDFENADKSSSIQLFQNIPNPMLDQTAIPFTILNAGEVAIRLIDMRGNEVYRSTQYFEKGKNQFDIQNKNRLSRGMYFYQVSFQSEIYTRKLIVSSK